MFSIVLRKVLFFFEFVVFGLVWFFSNGFLINVGGMLELSEAIRDYHDNTGLPHMVSFNVFMHCFNDERVIGL